MLPSESEAQGLDPKARVKDEVLVKEEVENLFHNYHFWYGKLKPFIERSYENMKWYFIVCSPYNRTYIKDRKFYDSNRSIRAILRATGSPAHSIITREIVATKTHRNMLVVTDKDLMKLHDTNKYRYHYHVQEVVNFWNRDRCLTYMLKEGYRRRLQCPKDISYVF